MIKGKYFDSIHSCPVLIWDKVMKTGDLKQIHRGGWYRAKKARSAWVKMYNEYIKEFGIPDAYRTYLNEMSRAADEFARSYSGEKWLRPIAQIRQAQAEGRISMLPKSDLNVSIANVSKAMGFRVDPSRITVAEFYGYVKGLK